MIGQTWPRAVHEKCAVLLRTRSAHSIRDGDESLTNSRDVWQQSIPSNRHRLSAWQTGGDHVCRGAHQGLTYTTVAVILRGCQKTWETTDERVSESELIPYRIVSTTLLCAVNAARCSWSGSGASPKMRVGPSKSACKSRLQTTSSCGGKELPW